MSERELSIFQDRRDDRAGAQDAVPTIEILGEQVPLAELILAARGVTRTTGAFLGRNSVSGTIISEEGRLVERAMEQNRLRHEKERKQ
jgi:hypothetical protein